MTGKSEPSFAEAPGPLQVVQEILPGTQNRKPLILVNSINKHMLLSSFRTGGRILKKQKLQRVITYLDEMFQQNKTFRGVSILWDPFKFVVKGSAKGFNESISLMRLLHSDNRQTGKKFPKKIRNFPLSYMLKFLIKKQPAE